MCIGARSKILVPYVLPKDFLRFDFNRILSMIKIKQGFAPCVI